MGYRLTGSGVQSRLEGPLSPATSATRALARPNARAQVLLRHQLDDDSWRHPRRWGMGASLIGQITDYVGEAPEAQSTRHTAITVQGRQLLVQYRLVRLGPF